MPIFEVERASATDNRISPCKRAKPCDQTITDTNGKLFVRRFWGVEINTLEELMAFSKEVESDLVLGVPGGAWYRDASDAPKLIIYDASLD